MPDNLCPLTDDERVWLRADLLHIAARVCGQNSSVSELTCFAEDLEDWCFDPFEAEVDSAMERAPAASVTKLRVIAPSGSDGGEPRN